jgi:hypothetical protein
VDQMNTADAPSQGDRFSTGCGVGVLVGGPAASGLVVLISQAYAACDVGINAGANSLALMLVLPVIWLANSLVFGAVFARVSDATWKRRTLGAVAALVALVLLAWLLFAWQGTPSDYPSPICRSNVPPWWPSWIPV